MHPKLPPSFSCKQCQEIARSLQDGWKSDLQALQARVKDVAISSGRDPQRVVLHWVFSMAGMPDDEMQTLLLSHYPRVAEAQRNKEQHETATGHSVILHGQWMLYPYGSSDSK